MTSTRGAGTTIMTIGELSRRTGMSAKALRRLEGMGLACSAGRSPAGYRLFDESAVWCVDKIHQLRALGLTTTEIRDLIEDHFAQPNKPHLAERLKAVRTRVYARIAELMELRQRIDDFEQRHRCELACRADGGLFADAQG